MCPCPYLCAANIVCVVRGELPSREYLHSYCLDEHAYLRCETYSTETKVRSALLTSIRWLKYDRAVFSPIDEEYYKTLNPLKRGLRETSVKCTKNCPREAKTFCRLLVN